MKTLSLNGKGTYRSLRPEDKICNFQFSNFHLIFALEAGFEEFYQSARSIIWSRE